MNILPRLSILQLMKSVAYFAVAFALIVPMLQIWRMGAINGGSPTGWVYVAIFEGVAVPLAWAALSLVLVRPGIRRDNLVTLFLLVSVAVALGFDCRVLVYYAIPSYWRGPGDAFWLAVHVEVFCVLGAAAGFLLRRLFSGRRGSWRVGGAR